MSTAVKLSNELVDQARLQAKVDDRSTSKQIEHWSKIGKIAEENPDMPFIFIRDILIGLEERRLNHTEPYTFG